MFIIIKLLLSIYRTDQKFVASTNLNFFTDLFCFTYSIWIYIFKCNSGDGNAGLSMLFLGGGGGGGEKLYHFLSVFFDEYKVYKHLFDTVFLTM